MPHQATASGQRLADLIAALDVLELNPQIGRPMPRGLRELVIGKRARGYLALYRYGPVDDVVIVLGLRSQRELGYGMR